MLTKQPVLPALHVFDSIETMLAPDALSNLLGVGVLQVERQPFVVAHRSANALHQILIESDSGPRRLILKEFQPQRDWVMRLTHDTLTREAMLYIHGVYAQMPPAVVVPVIAAARHGDTWANLMRDVSLDLLPLDTVQSEAISRLLIQHLAAIHAHFWNHPILSNPELGLSSLQDFVTVLSPGRVQGEIDSGRAHPVMELAARGWQQFAKSAPADVVEIIHSFQQNPAPLLAALDCAPKTLVHGDYKLPNLGLDGSQRAVVLDWQDAASGPGAMDLGYFLALNGKWLALGRSETIELYRTTLASYGHSLTLHELELGLVAGGALRLLWLMVLNNGNDLEWWYDLLRRVSVR